MKPFQPNNKVTEDAKETSSSSTTLPSNLAATSAARTVTPAQVQTFLTTEIEQRIAYLGNLIASLQNKIAAIAAPDIAAKAKANSPAGRLRWGRLP